jgi:hypothetical protein
MDDPETPVVDDGKVVLWSIEKGRQIKDRDGPGRVQEERGQFALLRIFEGGPESPKHKKQPE